MLEITDIKLKLLTYIDRLHIFNNKTHGGICHCSVRKATVNNTFFDNYYSVKHSTYIMYLDTLNLLWIQHVSMFTYCGVPVVKLISLIYKISSHIFIIEE